MSVERSGYPAFPTYPAAAGTVSPWRPIDATTQRVRVTLTGAFTVEVEISNAQARNVPEHLFLPLDTDAEIYATTSSADLPIDIRAPVRWVRLRVTSGSVTGGNVEQSSLSTPAASIEDVDELRVIAEDASTKATNSTDAISNTTLAQLSTRAQAAGPQFAAGSRWVYSATGAANGGTVVAAAGGGFWVREIFGSYTPEMFGAKGDGATDDSTAWANCVAAANAVAGVGGRASIAAQSVTYMIARGFLLASGVQVRGEGLRTILKLIPGLPPRSVESTQTAIFMGLAAFRNIDTAGNYNITIKDLSIELYQTDTTGSGSATTPMLGGIKLINANGCRIENVRITNGQSFGVQFIAAAGGPGMYENQITGCNILMPDWYTDVFGGTINQNSCTCISFAGTMGPNGNGAGDPAVNNPGNPTLANQLYAQGNVNYLPSNARRNIISGNVLIGGSHGAYFTNVAENTISSNTMERSSHRGIAFGNTCDRNSITGNTIRDVGSTGIHLSYSCEGNSITGNTINGVIATNGGEGYGIKGYVGVWNNTITGNFVTNARYCAISVSHGANGNTITGNVVTRGTAAQAGTIGIEANATRLEQYDGGLTYADTTLAVGNIILGNTVDGFAFGVMLTDDKSKTAAVKNNIVALNVIRNSLTHGISTSGRSSAVVTANTVAQNNMAGNGFNIVTDLRSGGNVLLSNVGDLTARQLISTSGNTATVAAGATPTKAEFDALLTELRNLKTNMGNGL